MNFAEFCSEVNTLGWADNPPTEVPRHIFAMYVAGFEVGITPQQFMKLMAARAFVSTTTVVLKNDKVPLAKGEVFCKLHQQQVHPRDAIPLLFTREEVQDQHLELFEAVKQSGI